MKLQTSVVRHSVLFSVIALLAAAPQVFAQSQSANQSLSVQAPRVAARITQAIDETQLVRLKGNVHPLARPEFDQGAVPDSQPMNRMLLLLQRSPDQEAALQQLLEEQQIKDSPNYHKWLTPQQFGAQFGPADADIQTVTDWLTHQGFQGIKVAAGRTVIEFSGHVAQVRNAFHTEIHRYLVNGEMRQANSTDLQIPAALTPVVAGIVSLHNFPRKSFRHPAGTFTRTADGRIVPQFTGMDSSGTFYAVGPADFAKIYNLPLTTPDGTGVTIGIVADSNINPQDIVDFRNLFGLAPNAPNIILNGPDPGKGPGEGEADLDVQVAGMVAQGSTIDLVVSEDTASALGTDLSALYIIDNNIAAVLSESFGDCEAHLGTQGNQFYVALWEQAAAQGITPVIAAGDAGSAGCDDFNTVRAAIFGLAVSGIASTPFNVAVGGTDFDDVGKQSSFWNATNSTDGKRESAMGYIPETPWNDSCAAAATSTTLNTVCATPDNILGGSGGPSNCSTSTVSGTTITCTGGHPKPSWQNGVNPASTRSIPDVSLFASDGPKTKSFYVICQADNVPAGQPPSCAPGPNGFSFGGAGGTSAAAPAFAGIMALINQANGRQGNPNPVLYKIAGTAGQSCNSSTAPLTGSSCAFYDITKGNDSVPCAGASPNCSSASASTSGVLVDPASTTTPAWTTKSGYDFATGLGSVNVTNLAAQWTLAVGTFKGTTTTTTVNGTTTPPPITHGQSVTLSAKVASTTTGTPTGDVSFLAPTSVNGGIGAATLSAGTATLASTFLPGGSYNVKAHYPGDGTFAPSDDPTGVPVVVSKENSGLLLGIVTFNSAGNVISPNATTVAYGSPYIFRMDILNQTGNSSNCQPLTATSQTQLSGCAFDATGTVTATDGSAALDAGTFPINSGGHAEDQPIQLAAGTHNLSATYSGDISYNAPASASTLTVTVTQAVTSTTVTAIPSTIPANGSVILTATVATISSGVGPTGTVQFKNGSTALGSAANCVPTNATATAPAFCTATLTTTLAFLAPPSAPNRLPTTRTPVVLLVGLALLILLLLNLKRVPAHYRRVYACVGLLLLAGLVTGLAVGCSSGYGGGGGVHYDSITAVYSGDTNYTGSTSPATTVTVQ